MSQKAVPHQDTAAGASKRRLLSPADNPLVRAVGRVPAGVHVKLLVAFVGTALLVVVLGVLGLRLIGQSNERVETLGTLQVRAFAYGKLRSDAGNIRRPARPEGGGRFLRGLALARPEQGGPRGGRLGNRPGVVERRHPASRVDPFRPARIPAAARGRGVPGQDPGRPASSSRGSYRRSSTSAARIVDERSLSVGRPSCWPSTWIPTRPSSRTPRTRGQTPSSPRTRARTNTRATFSSAWRRERSSSRCCSGSFCRGR